MELLPCNVLVRIKQGTDTVQHIHIGLHPRLNGELRVIGLVIKFDIVLVLNHLNSYQVEN